MRFMPTLGGPIIRHAFLLVSAILFSCVAEAQGLALSDAEARAVLAEWLSAQNSGKLPDYQPPYAPDFQGVRWLGDGVQSFDRDGWLRDRSRMFKKPARVEARDVEVGVGAEGSTTLIFTQIFASVTHEDEGAKWLRVRRYPEGMRIASEEMLRSRPKAKTVPQGPLPERNHYRAILFDGEFAEKAAAEAALRRFVAQLADRPVIYSDRYNDVGLPGRVVTKQEALDGNEPTYLVLIGICLPNETGELAKRLSDFDRIRVLPTSIWADDCPKPWPRPVERKVTAAFGSKRKLDVQTYVDKSLPLVSVALRDESERALDFVVKSAGQLIDDSTVSECSLPTCAMPLAAWLTSKPSTPAPKPSMKNRTVRAR
jgi:hypothetical protein